MKLPSPKEPLKLATERTEELDVELTEATSEEELEQVQDKRREELEQKKMTWDWLGLLDFEEHFKLYFYQESRTL